MSQEKVNKYKEQKANRKEIIQKEKRNKMIRNIIGAVIGIVLVVWIGYSVYDRASESIASAQTEVDFTAIDNYLSGLAADEAVE